jgi:hypothetical protein
MHNGVNRGHALRGVLHLMLVMGECVSHTI